MSAISIESLKSQLQGFKLLLPHQNVQSVSVSTGNVGWHIAHCVLVSVKLISALESSNTPNFKPKFSLLKWAMFTFKKIPRGKRKAPKIVQPPEQMDQNYFDDLFAKGEEKCSVVHSLPNDSTVQHPALGLINKEEAIKFLYVHNKHHLAIINEILEKRN